MNTTISPKTAANPAPVWQTSPALTQRLALLAIALGALVPLLILGNSEFIGYDGYWHLFIATQDRWKQFLFEYRGDAHPLLYVIVLRGLGSLSHSRLVLRSASILPGAAGVYLIGLSASRLCRGKASALLAAAAYGFAMVMIQIDIDVRSYPLCLFFILLAFYFLIDFLQCDRDPSKRRSLLAFSVFICAAIATEYYAMFFWIACLVAIPALVLPQRRICERIVLWTRENWRAALLAFALPWMTIAAFYFGHLRHQPPQYGHVGQFYWTPGSPRIDFILSNLRSDLNYILPVQIASIGVLLAVLFLAVTVCALFVLFRRRMAAEPFAVLPALITLLLLIQLIASSLLRRYPFGGFERQQSIFFPFLVLTGFILLDVAVSHIPFAAIRAILFAACAVWIALNFRDTWNKTPRTGQELGTREYRIFEDKTGAMQSMYIDQFSLILFYIHTHNSRWNFWRQLWIPQRIQEYWVGGIGGRKLLLVRNFDLWNFDLTRLEDYQVMAQALTRTDVSNTTLLLYRQIPGPTNPADISREKAQAGKLAQAAGLRATPIYYDSKEAIINFELQSP